MFGIPSSRKAPPSGKTGKKHPEKSGKTHKSSHAKHDPNQHLGNIEFFFAVNWIDETDDSMRQDRHCERGEFGDIVPFSHPDLYTEMVGPVYRYENGHVTKDVRCCWWRESEHQPGIICRYDSATEQSVQMTEYKTCSVFRCWRFNPILWMESDATVYPAGLENLHPIRFQHGGDGSSLVGVFGHRHVKGRNPSWLPSLVPPQYSNPFPDAQQSDGLSGELPLIIGMMALSQGRQRFNPTTQWKGNWRASELPNRDLNPGPEDRPWGVVVQVSYDPSNGEQMEALMAFEESKVVQE